MSVRKPVSRFLVLLLALIAATPSVRCATITATNFNGSRSNLLSRYDGTILTSGIVWLGSFGVGSASIANAVARGDLDYVQEQFTQFGRATSIFFNGLPGIYQDAITQAVEEGDSFAGQSVYTVISNQGMLRDADDLLIFEHEQVFLPDPSRIEPALLNIDNGKLIVGEYDRYQATLGPIYNEPMFSLHRVIPEPSSASLVLLAGLLLFSRRCRLANVLSGDVRKR